VPPFLSGLAVRERGRVSSYTQMTLMQQLTIFEYCSEEGEIENGGTTHKRDDPHEGRPQMKAALKSTN
jgi:hypothetical protein